MGTFRLFLAICVVVVHSGSIFRQNLLGGIIAVQTFYMISGFYMSLILTKKYVGEGSYGLFISNRILRLYPLYLVILALYAVCYFIGWKFTSQQFVFGYWAENISSLNIWTIVFLILTSLFVLGQDLLLFLKVNINGALDYTKAYMGENIQLYEFMFIPPAWTISLEFMFYFLAPFFVKLKTKFLLPIILILLGLRFFSYFNGFNHDPWNLRFFPFEAAFFLTGIICHRAYERFKDINIPVILSILMLIALYCYSILFQHIYVDYEIKQWFFYGCMIFVLPWLFKLFKNNKIDRFIGELSYPVYLVHVLLIKLIQLFFLPDDPPRYFSGVIIVTSILVSIALVKLISDPIEAYRQKRVEQKPSHNTLLEPEPREATA